ncbi:MAG: hypothetical protein QOH71_1418 [Blastocatellia bacterium]|nr:hypothetical protein [Blastocatellia bacterium]
MNERILNSSDESRVAKILRSNCEAVRFCFAKKPVHDGPRQHGVNTGSDRGCVKTSDVRLR